MSVAYLVRPRPDADWDKPRRKRLFVLRRVRGLLKGRGTRFTITREGSSHSITRDLGSTIRRLRARLAKERVGEVYRVRGDASPDRPVAVRVIETAPPPVPTPGIPAVDQFVGYLKDRWDGRWENWGICVCKHIAGTWNWSDHAYCAAIDVHGSADLMAGVAAFAASNAEKLHITYVIYNRRIWTRAEGWHYYSGSDPHTDHVHVSFEHGPNRIAC